MRLLGGLNILGAVGLRNGALGIPLRGAANIDASISNRNTNLCSIIWNKQIMHHLVDFISPIVSKQQHIQMISFDGERADEPLQLTSRIKLFDQSSPFGVKRHSGSLFQLLGSFCGWK